MKKIVIIGGGIAGLAAAHRLQEEIDNGGSLECVVLEAMDQFGGKIATERVDGFVIERGPDSFISQKPAAIELCKKTGDHAGRSQPDDPHQVSAVCVHSAF
jgi:oxygen-dependent protoporphyrinogen oxidase